MSTPMHWEDLGLTDTTETSGRAHTEQPKPVPNAQPSVWDLVIADMHARDILGRERYGCPVQPLNGRKSVRDAYEESKDQTVYLRQLMEELKLLASDLRTVADNIDYDVRAGELLDAVFTQYQGLLG
jgi:hypothetical protein